MYLIGASQPVSSKCKSACLVLFYCHLDKVSLIYSMFVQIGRDLSMYYSFHYSGTCRQYGHSSLIPWIDFIPLFEKRSDTAFFPAHLENISASASISNMADDGNTNVRD